jgi:xanthine dehydrogenase accessory factor
MREVASAILSILDRGERGALATVTRVSGSAPQVPGAKMALTPDGSQVGTVGGGRIEQIVLEAMRHTMSDGQTRTIKKHLAQDLGMCCGGQMEIFVEPIESRPQLILFGAGHVAKPTAQFASDVGFEVTVVDPREEQNNEERFPGARHVLMEPDEAVRRGTLPFGPDTLIVVVTHDHRLDEEALRVCLPKPRRYLGMIGSKRKVIRVFERVQARSPEADLSDVRAPVGLDLGAHTPEEIALSIVSELVAVRRGGTGKPMQLDAELLPEDPSKAEAS